MTAGRSESSSGGKKREHSQAGLGGVHGNMSESPSLGQTCSSPLGMSSFCAGSLGRMKTDSTSSLTCHGLEVITDKGFSSILKCFPEILGRLRTARQRLRTFCPSAGPSLSGREALVLEFRGLALSHIHNAPSPVLATSGCSSKVTSAVFLAVLKDAARSTLTFHPIFQKWAVENKCSSWAAAELMDQR